MTALPATAAPGPAAPPAPPALPTRLLWAILGVVLLADALDLIDSTITNIAAPTIVADLGGGAALVKWLGSAYAVALGVLLVVGGRLGDKFGQRRLFLVGMAGFTLASAACGLAPGPGLLILGRAVQGAFGALLIPQGVAILTTTFPRDLQTKAFSMFGPLLGIAGVAGPVLGGFIITADLAGLSWRPIFLINVVLGTVGVAVAARLLPHDVGDRSVVVDGIGATLLAGAMAGLMLGLIDGSSRAWTALPIASVAVGVVLFGLFAARQRTASAPLIRPTLLANRGFTAGLLTGLVFFAVTSGLAYVLSLFLQEGLRVTPGQASLGLLPLTLGIIAAAGGCMALIGRLGRLLVFAGLVITVVGVGWIALLVRDQGTDLGLWALAPAVFVVGLGMGTCFGTIFDIALGDIAPEEAGSASGSLSAVQQLAAGIGSSTVTTVYFHAAGGGQPHAVLASLLVVMAAAVVCLPVAALLPRHARPGAGEHH